jgi:23S rRNA (guanosine2251-2'-O)-methyltransferase
VDEFEFRECEWDGCLFRFPVEVEIGAGNRCPRCGSGTRFAGIPHQTLSGYPYEGSDQLLVGVLDNIRSIHNVGSIFRTSDGARLQHLYLNGITATPANAKLNKAALGAQERVPWTYRLNGPQLAMSLKQQGYFLLGLETAESEQPLFSAGQNLDGKPLAIIVGNERAGIDPGILAQCDMMLSLPMGGIKRSLNVAVAFGIVAYYLRYGAAV